MYDGTNDKGRSKAAIKSEQLKTFRVLLDRAHLIPGLIATFSLPLKEVQVIKAMRKLPG